MWNILRRNGQNLTRFYIYIATGKLYVGIENRHFCMFVIESRPLIEVGFRVISWGWFCPTGFDQILYTHYNQQDRCLRV